MAPNHCCAAAGLFFNGGIKFRSDFSEAVGGFGNLSRSEVNVVGGSAILLEKNL